MENSKQATVDIPIPPKNSPPSYKMKSRFRNIFTKRSTVTNTWDSPSMFTEDETSEDFKRRILYEQVTDEIDNLQQRNPLFDLSNGGKGWKSFIELWLDKCADAYPEIYKMQSSGAGDGYGKEGTLHSTIVECSVELKKEKTSLRKRLLRLFLCCTKGNALVDVVDSFSSTVTDGTQKEEFVMTVFPDTAMHMRRCVSTSW